VLRNLEARICQDFPFTFFTQQPHQQTRRNIQNNKDAQQSDEQEVVDESDFGAEIGWANILSAASSFERQTTAETPTDTERSRKKKKRSGAKEPYARELE